MGILIGESWCVGHFLDKLLDPLVIVEGESLDVYLKTAWKTHLLDALINFLEYVSYWQRKDFKEMHGRVIYCMTTSYTYC